MSPSGRTAKVAFVAVIISALTSAGASTASAATAPPPVRAVVVRGTSTPLELTLSWTPPADAAYAGARVVVVPGATATTNPADPAAVFAQNAPAPVTSVTWSAGTAGQKYSASVFAYEATATAFAPAATAAISLPDPIKHLATEPAYGSIFAYFVLPANADAAVLCQRLDRVPTSPADATKCSAPQASGVSDWALARDAVVPLAVFSVDTRTGIYGPGVSAGDGALPPMTPSVQLWSASPARLGVVWTHSTGEVADLGGTVRSGGNVGWRILIAPGTRTPVGNPAARQITILRSAVTVENDKYGEIRRTDLSVVPDLPYTVVVRGFDAEGNLSPWSSAVTGATVTPGTRLDVRGTDGGWRSSVVAGPTLSDNAAMAVDPLGVTHALNGRVLMRRSAGGAWTRVQLPPRIFGTLTLAGTRSSAGTIAFADRNCVFVKPRTGSWRKVGCLTVAPNVSGQRGLGLKDVFAVEVDRFGAVHVLYSGNQADCRCASLHYATNRTGRWTVTRLRNIADRQTGEAEHSTEKGVADMTYDPVTDKVVVVVGDPAATGTYTLSVGTKPAAALGFGRLSARLAVTNDRAVVPSDVVSYGDRITMAARRANASSGTAWATPVLLTGTSAVTVGGLTAIPDARATDEHLALAAQSRTRVLVGWNHLGFSTNEQGVWTSWRTYDARGRAATAHATRRTRSAYDDLDGVAVDARGRAYVLYRRLQGA